MAISSYGSWGYKPSAMQQAQKPAWREDLAQLVQSNHEGSLLAYGNGRSYGDSCLNSSGTLLDAIQLDKYIEFNPVTGVLKAEAGMTLSKILALIVEQGWFLPVTPGTSFVTLGGAVANDVHGKNHHCDGTFGRYVQQFELVRSSGEVLTCSPSENNELFDATIGGLGLTGFIATVTIQLIPINSSQMDVRVDAFHGLQEFTELSSQRKANYQYTVAWLDCASKGDDFARGIFLSANHATEGELKFEQVKNKIEIPFNFPSWTLNKYSISAFNKLYFGKEAKQDGKTNKQSYQPYFYPLDAIGRWNRIYGSSGFYQYQFVVPLESLSALETILGKIVDSGMGSFLAVLKEFGDIESPGMLSFPRKGYCLALDFANRGAKTEQLIKELDELVMECGGAAYPAKDRLMSAAAFSQYFPKMSEFKTHMDPKFSSDFWERVSG